jgi:hypothetical protein
MEMDECGDSRDGRYSVASPQQPHNFIRVLDHRRRGQKGSKWVLFFSNMTPPLHSIFVMTSF